MTQRRFVLAASLGCALLVAACQNEVVNSTGVPPYPGGARFQRYVAMGNSITAGFQSGGISDTLQRRSLPGPVARGKRRARVFLSRFAPPRRPPPDTNAFTPHQRTP